MIRDMLAEKSAKTHKAEIYRWGSEKLYHKILRSEISLPIYTNSTSSASAIPPAHRAHKVVKAMDKISDLPKIIIHDILSRLPEKDVARTSILSKTWHDIWSTFPILVFNGFNRGVFLIYVDKGNPQKMQDYMRKVNNFLTSVDSSLLRFHDRSFAIKEFNLSMRMFDHHSLPSRIDHWMKIASESGVKVLKLNLNLEFEDIYFGSDPLDKHYGLPLSVLEAKSLTKLELSGEIRVDQAFLNFGIKFSSLQILSLDGVYLGHEQALLNLISSCPLIENLTLSYCRGLEVVRIYGMPKLKVAKFFLMQEVDVDAPSLEHLHFGTDEIEFPSKINMDKCSSLKELILSSVSSIFVTSQWLLDLFGKFPLLENLELDGCIMSERIKISSARLKVLNFGACSDLQLKEAEIDTPNLESCRFCGIDFTIPIISFLNTSIQLEFNVMFVIKFRLDFEGLRKFIQSIKPRDVLASMTLKIIYGTIEFNPDALQDISFPSPRIKLLNLYVCPNTEELCLPLVTGLFWSFRPTIVSLKLKFCSKIFIKLFCEKLTCKQEEEGCCSSSQIKCWWHDLKDVKVISSSENFENVIDCQTLLDSLSSQTQTLLPKDEISFRLEWDSLD